MFVSAQRADRVSDCRRRLAGWVWVLGLFALLAAVLAQAAVHEVTTAADSGPGSLRTAIAAANASPDDDEIVFAPGLDHATPIVLLSGQLLIQDNGRLTLRGEGRIVVDGNANGRVIDIADDANVVIEGMTLRNGEVDWIGTRDGGGLYVGAGATVALDRVVVSGNRVAANSMLSGGGIYLSNGANAVLTNVAVVDNTAENRGGGIFVAVASTLTMFNSTVSGNNDGGIASAGTLRLINSTVTNNHSGNRAGIYTQGTLELVNSIVAGNTGSHDCGQGGGSTVRSYSLVGSGTCDGGGGPGNLSGDAMLAALEDPGDGSPPYHLPLPGSPVLDAGTDTCGTFDCPLTDVRGVARPQGAAFDMGAAERRADHALSVNVTGEGSVDAEPAPAAGGGIVDCIEGAACTATYHEGDALAVTLSAAPAPGWHLAAWGGDCTADAGDPNLAVLTMDADRSCTASFARNPAAAVTVQGAAAQSAQVLAPFTAPLVVRVADAADVALQGITVNFAATSAGNGASAALSSATATTDASGLASITATANAIVGSYTVQASVSGVAVPATFDLTNTLITATLTLSAAPANVPPGATSTLTAAVTGDGPLVPGGTVDFLVDGVIVCAAVPLDAAGIATCIVGPLAPGNHGATASYSGDAAHAAVTAAIALLAAAPIPTMVPANDPWALALLIALLALFGAALVERGRGRA